MGSVVELKKRRDAGVNLKGDIPAAATVPAIGAAERLELLTQNGGTAVAAVTRLHVQGDSVYERWHRMLQFSLVWGYWLGLLT